MRETRETDDNKEKLNLTKITNFIYFLELLQVGALEENSDIKPSDAIHNPKWNNSDSAIKKILNDEGQKSSLRNQQIH